MPSYKNTWTGYYTEPIWETRKLMYQTTFRIPESTDEYFYARELFNYHRPLPGLGLSDSVLKKVYVENAKKIFNR
jgi:hypothetical protein